MQLPPLLVKLDWVFTNNSWPLSYPKTSYKALVMEVSDHTPWSSPFLPLFLSQTFLDLKTSGCSEKISMEF